MRLLTDDHLEALRVVTAKYDTPKYDRLLMAVITGCVGASYLLMFIFATN